jgi:serine/threonine protein kinase
VCYSSSFGVLRHPNLFQPVCVKADARITTILVVYDCESRRIWPTTALMKGVTVYDLIRRPSFKLSVNQKLYIGCAVLDAVHFLHNSALIHRDLFLGNVMMTCEDEVVIIDGGGVETRANNSTEDAEQLGGIYTLMGDLLGDFADEKAKKSCPYELLKFMSGHTGQRSRTLLDIVSNLGRYSIGPLCTVEVDDKLVMHGSISVPGLLEIYRLSMSTMSAGFNALGGMSEQLHEAIEHRKKLIAGELYIYNIQHDIVLLTAMQMQMSQDLVVQFITMPPV